MTLREKLSRSSFEGQLVSASPDNDTFEQSGKTPAFSSRAYQPSPAKYGAAGQLVDPLLGSTSDPIGYFLRQAATGKIKTEGDLLELPEYVQEYIKQYAIETTVEDESADKRRRQAMTDFVSQGSFSDLSQAELSFIQAMLLYQLLQ